MRILTSKDKESPRRKSQGSQRRGPRDSSSEQDRNMERGCNGNKNGENKAVREQEESSEDAAAWALEMQEERPRAEHAGILKKPEKARTHPPLEFLSDSELSV